MNGRRGAPTRWGPRAVVIAGLLALVVLAVLLWPRPTPRPATSTTDAAGTGETPVDGAALEDAVASPPPATDEDPDLDATAPSGPTEPVDPTEPDATAIGTRTMSLQGFRLPASPTAGPRVAVDGRASGFARTDLGAALAAVHISIRTGALVGPGVYGPTITEQVVGPHAERLRTRTDAEYNQERTAAGVASGEPLFTDCAASGPGCSRVLGYEITRRDGDDIVVHLLVHALDAAPGATELFDARMTVRWSDGDWRLVAPPGGDWSDVVVPAADDALSQYVSFGGRDS